MTDDSGRRFLDELTQQRTLRDFGMKVCAACGVTDPEHNTVECHDLRDEAVAHIFGVYSRALGAAQAIGIVEQLMPEGDP